MPLRRPNRLMLAACLLAAPCAHALERVTLHNGFSYDCARREPIDATHVRLYLSAETSNYIDLTTVAIASVEALPDPPPPPPPPIAIAPVLDTPALIALAGAAHNIDVELLASVIHTESNFRTNAVSRSGARGLMQLMPATAKDLGVDDAFRPDQNIRGGTAYLDALLTRYKDNLSLALAAYNAGSAAVDRYHGIPPYRETRNYVSRVEREFIRRKSAAQHTNLASR